MKVEIDGVLYAPVTQAPMEGEQAREAALECVSGLHAGGPADTAHSRCRYALYRILGIVRPDVQRTFNKDGAGAAFAALSEPDDG